MAKKIRDKLGQSLGGPKHDPSTMPVGPTKAPGNIEDDYEARGHLDDLVRAETIKADPAKMAKVHKLAGRRQKAIRSIQDLKDAGAAFGAAKKAKMEEGM